MQLASIDARSQSYSRRSTVQYFILSVLLVLLAVPSTFAGEVDINSADAQTLATELQGIGLTKARAIVEHRDTYGNFASADELALVKGIGLRTVDINRDNIKVGKAKGH
ncbi:MAG: competence protein ComEA [Gammaproteobacteria bacterium]|nr:competence protein ComEA [Gammaproteobacteria bacterium]